MPLIDHSSCDALLHAVREADYGGIPIQVNGLDRMQALSEHSSSVRLATGDIKPLPA